MNKKIVIAGAAIGAMAIVGAGTYVFLNLPKGESPTIQNLSTILVHTPQTTTPLPTKTPIEEVGKLLIIPATYKLSEKDLSVAKEESIQTIFLNQPETAETTNVVQAHRNEFNFQQVSPNSSYKKCSITQLSDSIEAANETLYAPYYIAKGTCTDDTKVLSVKEMQCNIKDSDCQVVFVENIHGSSLSFFESDPLTYSFAMPQVTVEMKNGIAITTWTQQPPRNITQSAYSVEYLNAAGSRITASGRIDAANQGDYFLPPMQLTQQLLSVKLRIWYKIKDQVVSTPAIYQSSFTYTYSQENPASNSTTPVQMSWIPDWGMDAGIASVKANPKKWHTISPVWFTPNGNGTLNVEPTTNSGKLIPLLRANKIKIIPTISLFDADILKDILRNHKAAHIDAIVRVVNGNNYDGIDLDYESTYQDDKELLTQFITELAVKLHANNKTLSFTALPKIDDRQIYAFLPQTHVAQDWKAIGAVVDEFRIMAYDFTGQGSKQPGPLSPIVWNELLIQYAIANIPAQKVVLALPLYAHGWPKPTTSNLAGDLNDQNLSAGILKNTISPQHDNIAYMKSHSIYFTETYDPWHKEMRVDLKYNGVERVMYYLNKTAVDERLQLAQKYGIKGICYWRIGGEIL